MSDADTTREERKSTGGTIELSPLEFVYLHDNDSLNGAGDGDSLNRGKNTNVFSPKTVRSTAMGYARGLKPETTGMISCSSSPDSGTPPSWLKCCLAAIQHLRGDKEASAYYPCLSNLNTKYTRYQVYTTVSLRTLLLYVHPYW